MTSACLFLRSAKGYLGLPVLVLWNLSHVTSRTVNQLLLVGTPLSIRNMAELASSGPVMETPRCNGSRVGDPILDPPTASRNQLIREDQPYYIVAGFVKLFPPGRGDSWAHLQRRKDNEQPLPH